MRMFRNILKLSGGAVVAALLMTACSKPEEPPVLPPIVPVPKKTEQSKAAPPPGVDAPRPVVQNPVKPPATAVPATVPAAGDDTAPQLENAYLANPDFTERVQNIYKLSDLGTPEAIASLGRLFRLEKDPDLKTEILDSLFDIDGQDERKATLLAAGALANEPKDVRQSAIDGLGNIDGKYAIPILQALAGDPDEDIRESVKDTIEQLQTQQALENSH